MASPNAAFSIADGEQLPFNPAPHSTDVTEDFTVEISLLSAQFKTQNSAAVALDSSPTAAAPSAAGGAAAAASSTAPKKAKKRVDTSIYALPESSSKKCVFKNAAPGKASAAAITLSPDPATEDDVLACTAGTTSDADGDTVSVANLPFSEEPAAVVEDTSRISPDLVSQLVRYGAIALGLLFAYFAIARPLMRPVPLPPIDPDLPDSPQGRAAQRMREEIKEMDLSWSMGQEVKRAQELRVEKEIEAQMERMREREVASKAKFENVVAYATQYATDQPDDTALLLRAWVSETGAGNASGLDKA